MKEKITAETTWKEFLEANFEELVNMSPLSDVVCELCPFTKRCDEEIEASDTDWWVTPKFRCKEGLQAVLNSPIGDKVDFELFAATILKVREPLGALSRNGLKHLKKQ